MGLHAVAASPLVFSLFHPVDQTNVYNWCQNAQVRICPSLTLCFGKVEPHNQAANLALIREPSLAFRSILGVVIHFGHFSFVTIADLNRWADQIGDFLFT